MQHRIKSQPHFEVLLKVVPVVVLNEGHSLIMFLKCAAESVLITAGD